MYKPTNEEYKFSTLKDIMGFVTEENIELFLIDFGTMLRGAVDFRRTTTDIAGKLTKDKDSIQDVYNSCSDIELSWIDDGKHEYTNKSRIIIDNIEI